MQVYERLEVEWAEFNQLDPKGMVACASGTAALHLALEAFRLPLGSQVIVPDYTMIACPRVVTLAGLTPVFVDCDERLLMSLPLVSKAVGTSGITNSSTIVMIVHVYGRKADVGYLRDAFIRCPIVEDLAEAHGVRPHPVSDAACWSFYKNKIVAGEEGGAVWFRDPEHANLARQLRSLGFTDAHDYTHIPRGHNYRLANTLAELILGIDESSGLNGLDNYKENAEQRLRIEGWYDTYCPTKWRQPKRDAVWVYDLRISGMTADVQRRAVDLLRKSGIEARYGFKPCSSQAEYDCYPVTEYGQHRAAVAAQEVIYLPVQPGITTRADCQRAFDLLRAATA